jgi:hypothetical protein
MNRLRVETDAEDHDDEFADFEGEADVGLIAVTAASYVAAAALLHRSAAKRTAREASRRALAELPARMRRRGGVALADTIAAAPGPGTSGFGRMLRSAAAEVAGRVRALPRQRLVGLLGRHPAAELIDLGANALLRGGVLPASQIDALSAHLADGAELAVGLGRGRVFVKPKEAAEHKIVEVETRRLPDPRRASTQAVRHIRRRGASAREEDVPATLMLITWAGKQELRLCREGRDIAGTLLLPGVINRLSVRIVGRRIECRPVARVEPGLPADWGALHRAIHEDALLADLLGKLYGKAGFGGSAECLGALLELAPLIHSHEDIARRTIGEMPDRLQDPMAEVMQPLRIALRAGGK